MSGDERLKLLILAEAGQGDAEAEAAEMLGLSPVLLRLEGDAAGLEASLGEALRKQGGMGVHVAVLDNERRRELAAMVERLGAELATLVHPRAWVAGTATVEAGAWIAAGALVQPLARIGRGARLGCGVVVEHHNQIGDWARLDAGVALAGRVTVGEGAVLREKVSVRPMIRIGAGAVVGMGAAVVRDVAEGARVQGVPAK